MSRVPVSRGDLPIAEKYWGGEGHPMLLWA